MLRLWAGWEAARILPQKTPPQTCEAARGRWAASAARTSSRPALRSRVRGAQHVAVHDAQGQQAKQREEHDDKAARAGVDQPRRIFRRVLGAGGVGDVPAPAVQPDSHGEPDRDQQDDQKYCHRFWPEACANRGRGHRAGQRPRHPDNARERKCEHAASHRSRTERRRRRRQYSWWEARSFGVEVPLLLQFSIALFTGMVAATFVPPVRRSIPRLVEVALWIGLITVCVLGVASVTDPNARDLSFSALWAADQVLNTIVGLLLGGVGASISANRFALASWLVIVAGADVLALMLVHSLRNAAPWQPRVRLREWMELPVAASAGPAPQTVFAEPPPPGHPQLAGAAAPA